MFATLFQSQFERHVCQKNEAAVNFILRKTSKLLPLRQVCYSEREKFACTAFGPACERASSYALSAKDHLWARNLLHSCSTCWCFWCLFWYCAAATSQVERCALRCSPLPIVFCFAPDLRPNGAQVGGGGGIWEFTLLCEHTPVRERRAESAIGCCQECDVKWIELGLIFLYCSSLSDRFLSFLY